MRFRAEDAVEVYQAQGGGIQGYAASLTWRGSVRDKRLLVDPARRTVWTGRVHVQIHDLDAALRFPVQIAGSPSAVLNFDRMHLGNEEAFPFGRHERAFARASGELIDERFLLSLAVPEDNRTERPLAAVIHARHRLAGSHRFGDLFVGRTRHGLSVWYQM